MGTGILRAAVGYGLLLPVSAAEPMTPFDFSDDGVLWAINRTLFHPRGYAIGYDSASREWFLLGDGSEPWRYADTLDEEKSYRAFKALLARRG